ncbi:hypothetical protein HYV89_04690 [Candidatus Woesearchaeota archaeon]|nr:hypothetical protein [Candidatus Woesearchaeota archaeon]
MELWNETVVEKSYDILNKIKEELDFIIIGGWASWFHTKTVKSKDIDIYVDFGDFFNFQKSLANKGIFISLNQKLKKYESKIDDVDIDIYTPNYCDLIIPCKDVFFEKWFKKIDGFNVILPEPFLILKLKAEENRSGTIKGFKDRIDILAMIHKSDLDRKFLSEIEKRYKFDAKGRVSKIIRTAKKEFEYFFPEYQNLRLLKKLKLDLMKKLD